jgi:hypothetical protein
LKKKEKKKRYLTSEVEKSLNIAKPEGCGGSYLRTYTQTERERERERERDTHTHHLPR